MITQIRGNLLAISINDINRLHIDGTTVYEAPLLPKLIYISNYIKSHLGVRDVTLLNFYRNSTRNASLLLEILTLLVPDSKIVVNTQYNTANSGLLCLDNKLRNRWSSDAIVVFRVR